MDREYLLEALQQAEIRRGFCAPNPSVGAIVVKDGRIIGKGYHLACGRPHAEVAALEAVTEAAEGSTVYVTLEPCCFKGRTPACTDYLISKRVARVVFSHVDPNPRVSGQGKKQLEAAGITCGQLAIPEITRFYRSYNRWVEKRRPWVTAKIALSMDGKIAGKNGEPVRLSGETAAEFVHRGRLRSDAILTTARTIVYDNPQLNARLEGGVFKKQVFVIDTCGIMPPDCRLWQTAEKIVIFHGPKVAGHVVEANRRQGADTVEVTPGNLPAILDHIGQAGIHDLWVEAGGTLFSSMLKDRHIDTAYLTVSPRILGPDAVPAFQAGFDLEAKESGWVIMGTDALYKMEW